MCSFRFFDALLRVGHGEDILCCAATSRKLLNKGLSVAIEDAVSPRPFSTVDQIAKSVNSYTMSSSWVSWHT